MHRFAALEQLGVTAAISDISDGDCSRLAPQAYGKEGFLATLGLPPASLVLPRQVHGDRVFAVRERGGEAVEADGVATNLPGLSLGITVADCVPLLLYCAEPRCAAAVHAGREGTRLNIAARAVAALETHFGASPAALHAVIGPSACPDCYEVSQELAEDWAGAGLPLHGRRLDLWAANRQQLEAAGIPGRQIYASEICTICTSQFHSHRGTGTPCRNLAVIHFA